MNPYPANDYAKWRGEALRAWVVGETTRRADVPPEALMQAVWFHQRLQREKLIASDGRTVRVLHPGFRNREPGPDFRDAIVQFGTDTPQSGDVEIDSEPSDWRAHGHDRNPAFAGVILHVVWRSAGNGERPTLTLESFLDSPLAELAWWHGEEGERAFPKELTGRCCAPLRELSTERLQELLRQAAFLRMQSKAAMLHARARQAGWEQALWEGLFRGLGYKWNQWPMLRLGELRSRLCPEDSRRPAASVQARLLGVGGLLPAELPRRSTADTHIRQLWDEWWRERDSFADCTLPRSAWNFAGLRPANHPERRLALAAQWLADAELPSQIERWATASTGASDDAHRLLEAMQVAGDSFWSRHWTLRSAQTKTPQPMLGATRVTDLAMNVVLPWLWVRAWEGRNEPLRTELERRYFAWPAAEDNASLRLARQRLLAGGGGKLFRTAATQQGLLQVVADFCAHSNALCDECRFPDLVRDWGARP